MPTIVKLPPSFTSAALYGFTGAVVSRNGTPKDTTFIFEFDHLNFIDGCGLTVLCNTMEYLGAQGASVFLDKYESEFMKDAIVYLDDCGFFRRYFGSPLRSSARARSTTLPATQVKHTQTFNWLTYIFLPWAANLLAVEEAALATVHGALGEVFNNVDDHSSRDTAFVHAQHYPARKEVRVTISDFGTGIPANVRRKVPGLTDGAAILRATQRGFTTKSKTTNMGVGLDSLVECAVRNHGSVSIYSYLGALRCGPSLRGGSVRHATTGSSSYPGTLVELVLRTDRFVGDDTAVGEVTL